MDTMLAPATVVTAGRFVFSKDELFTAVKRGVGDFIETAADEFDPDIGVPITDSGDTFNPLIGRLRPLLRLVMVMGNFMDGMAALAAVAGELRGPGYTSGAFISRDC